MKTVAIIMFLLGLAGTMAELLRARPCQPLLLLAICTMMFGAGRWIALRGLDVLGRDDDA